MGLTEWSGGPISGKSRKGGKERNKDKNRPSCDPRTKNKPRKSSPKRIYLWGNTKKKNRQEGREGWCKIFLRESRGRRLVPEGCKKKRKILKTLEKLRKISKDRQKKPLPPTPAREKKSKSGGVGDCKVPLNHKRTENG